MRAQLALGITKADTENKPTEQCLQDSQGEQSTENAVHRPTSNQVRAKPSCSSMEGHKNPPTCASITACAPHQNESSPIPRWAGNAGDGNYNTGQGHQGIPGRMVKGDPSMTSVCYLSRATRLDPSKVAPGPSPVLKGITKTPAATQGRILVASSHVKKFSP